MKRTLSVVLILLMTSLSGCLSDDSKTSTNSLQYDQLIEEMELEISNLSTQLESANASLIELQNANSYYFQMYSHLNSINQSMHRLNLIQNQLENLSSELASENVSVVHLQSQLDNLHLQLSIANSTIEELQTLLESYSEGDPSHQIPLVFEEYNSTGVYMNHAKWTGGLWSRTTFDEYGIPLVNYSWGQEYVPTTAFHWGLVSVSKWLEYGEQNDLDAAVDVAEWAVTNQSTDGAWKWYWSHNYSGGVLGELSAGWPGGMTQGLGISFMVRMYSITNDSRYINSALNATKPLQELVEDGGVLRMYDDEWWWYEEYPTPDNGSYVLNGFIYTLIGLYDLWTEYDSEIAGNLYLNGTNALVKMISLFDLGCSTTYDLVHHSIAKSAPNIARPGYHNLHVTLLSVLNVIGNDFLIDVEERWAGYAIGQCFESPNGANAN